MCAECATLRQALEDSHASEQELQRNVEALQAQLLRTARAEQAARAELTKHREDSPKAKEIRIVLDHYVNRFNKTKAFKVGPDSERWRDVEKALRQHTVEELKEAIDGLHALPYVGPHGRQPTAGPGAERHDEIDIAIRNEKHVDRFRGYVAKAKAMQGEGAEKRLTQAVRRLERDHRTWADPVGCILDELSGLGCQWRIGHSGTSWSAQCPAHEDRSPSLSISWNGAGDRLLVHCFAGCETAEVMAALGLPLAILFRDESTAA